MTESVDRLLLNARKHAKRGETDQARRIYETVLARFPKNKRAQKGLASLAAQAPPRPPVATGPSGADLNAVLRQYEAGQLAAAAEAAQSLAARFPGSADIHDLLGTIWSGLGKLDQAAASYRMALRLQPTRSAAHNNLAVTLMAQDRHGEAIDSCRAAIRHDPRHPDAYNNLGNALQFQGDLDGAREAYESALVRDPKLAEAHNNLGMVLIDLARPDDAVRSFEEAIRLDSGYIDALRNLAKLHTDCDRLDVAETLLRRLIDLRPDDAAPYAELGQHLAATGDLGGARAMFERALALDPTNASALSGASVTEENPDYASQIVLLSEVLSDKELSGRRRAATLFLLARAYEKAGDPEQAFARYQEANAIKRKLAPFVLGDARAEIEKIKNVWQAHASDVADTAGSAGFTPIFIVGMPRSGSTLVEQILVSHSQVAAAGETSAFPDALGQGNAALGELTPESLVRIRAAYGGAIAEARGAAAFVTDKNLFNFKWVGHILAAYPHARIINTCRDARANGWSIYKTNFAAPIPFANDLDDIAAYYRLYRETMAFWHDRLPNRIIDLDYQALTEDPEGQVRQLLQEVGLDWEDACLAFHETERAVKTASKYQVRQAMYQGSNESWKLFAPFLGRFVADLEAY